MLQFSNFFSLSYFLIFALLISSETEGKIFRRHENNVRIAIKMKAGRSFPASLKGFKTQRLFASTYIINVNSNETAANAVIKELTNREDVEYVHKSMMGSRRPIQRKTALTPRINADSSVFNDPLLRFVWSFKSKEYSGISVEDAYRQYGFQATTPVIVAVVDSGVDYSHEDLKDVMWKNPGEIPGNGFDDDENGYIDDVYGINTVVRDNYGNATADVMDVQPHGTHIAGIIAAKQNNKIGIAGIASNALIMAIKVLPETGNETDVDVAEALIYAAKNGARIINCSFGKYDNNDEKLIPDTLRYLAENYDVLVVNSAGNDGENIDKKLRYPAAFDNDNLFVVASTQSNGTLAPFSNFGKKSVDIAAPGIEIYSTVPGNRYELMSGTSMAAPAVAGVLAEVLSHHPQLSYKELINIITESATANRDYLNKMVYPGRVDLLTALEVAEKYH